MGPAVVVIPAIVTVVGYAYVAIKIGDFFVNLNKLMITRNYESGKKDRSPKWLYDHDGS